MAELVNKYPQNAAGSFYVDDQCIDCDLCRETAPANFTRNDDGGHSYVDKQPESPEEEALCKEAMEGCPVEAIGDDSEYYIAPAIWASSSDAANANLFEVIFPDRRLPMPPRRLVEW